MDYIMEKGFIQIVLIQKYKNMKVILKMEKPMEKAYFIVQMEIDMKEI